MKTQTTDTGFQKVNRLIIKQIEYGLRTISVKVATNHRNFFF